MARKIYYRQNTKPQLFVVEANAGVAGQAVPGDIAELFPGVFTNGDLYGKLNRIRITNGERPLSQGDIPTNTQTRQRLHTMARRLAPT